ncbi:MAG TPA: carboxylesterase family protein, partial [Caulobacteraceae bacterium]|nr:carboxylesterase family protein [Caulobacteraceae bacterium]
MTDVQDEVRELDRTGVVQTTNGPVRGYREDGLQVFKGLRYGAAPIGRLRFQPPQTPARWAEVADAVSLGAPAIQGGVPPGETTG